MPRHLITGPSVDCRRSGTPVPSVAVRIGQTVQVGRRLGNCGNSGNSTEPHVHLQAMDRVDVLQASAVPVTFGGHLPRNGQIIELG